MIGLDTNVLVRLLTNDDPQQSARAHKYVESNCDRENRALINREVLLETVWVLESAYSYTREDVANAVDAILQTVGLMLESDTCVREALRHYRGGADFADALIATTNDAAGCTNTLTFDKKAASQIDQFALL